MTRLLFLLAALIGLSGFSTMDDVRQLLRDGREVEALRLSEQRTAARDPEGMEALAWFYDEGRVVAQDRARAAALFRRAAEAGRKHSQWRLGVMLDEGDGVTEDPEEAFRWFLRSADQGYARAFVSLGVMYATGRGTAQDLAKAMQSYLRGAMGGESHGFYGVGVLYARGEGVPQDSQEGAAWFGAAAALGDGQGQRALEIAREDGIDMERAAVRTRAILQTNGQDAGSTAAAPRF